MKNWEDIVKEGLTDRATLLAKLDVLSSYNFEAASPFSVEGCNMVGVENWLLRPNFTLINELNTSFIDLMKIDYKYSSKRIVPVSIIRSLIDIAALFYAYTIHRNKRGFLNSYHKGAELGDIRIKGKALSVSAMVKLLDDKYKGLTILYNYCCRYVHSGYDRGKNNSVFDVDIECGRKGFLGKQYKLKEEDFTLDVFEGYIEAPLFDYEEECDITEAALWVNKILKELSEAIRGMGSNFQAEGFLTSPP